uniref:Putative ovule protein n=1 Tax=Solanum chacoense TaxID=4108 RepID=A0A0V0HE85_SOLCH
MSPNAYCIHHITTPLSMSWIRIKFCSFPPDELLDIIFSERWLLKIQTERPRTNRFFVDFMKRCQVWVTESFISSNTPAWIKDEHLFKQIYSSRR